MFGAFRPRETEDDGRPNRVRLVEGRQRPYAVVAAPGSFGALLQDKLWITAKEQIQEFKTKTRKLYKLKSSLAALQAEVAAGRLPSSIGPGALRSHAHTGFADLDTAAEAEAAAQYRELLQNITAAYIQQKEAGITRLTDELKHIKTAAAPTALNTTFNSLVAGSAHAQELSIQEVLTEFKQFLELSMSAVENELREGAVLRESNLLAAVERRTQHQLQRQQREQAFGVTAEALAAAAAAAGAAAVTSAIATTAAAGAAPAGDTNMADGENAAEGDTQPLPLNQEQQQQQEQGAQAAASAAMTPQQLAAAVQAGINASISHLLQHGLMPQPPATPPQPRPRNRPPGGNGRHNRPRQQQQQPRNRPQQPQQQQQQRNRPRTAQQQQPRRSPNGPVPRQQDQPRHNPPQRQQQQQQRRPNGAAGRTNANDGYRRTGNGGNRGQQARRPSH
jgi:hypothetical protein